MFLHFRKSREIDWEEAGMHALTAAGIIAVFLLAYLLIHSALQGF